MGGAGNILLLDVSGSYTGECVFKVLSEGT